MGICFPTYLTRVEPIGPGTGLQIRRYNDIKIRKSIKLLEKTNKQQKTPNRIYLYRTHKTLAARLFPPCAVPFPRTYFGNASIAPSSLAVPMSPTSLLRLDIDDFVARRKDFAPGSCRKRDCRLLRRLLSDVARKTRKTGRAFDPDTRHRSIRMGPSFTL